jgi:hypothetical protein
MDIGLSPSPFAEDKRPLGEVFSHKDPAPERELPPAFDSACRKCGTGMERVDPVYCTRRKPYATFQCANGACMERLLIFDAPRAPFIIRSVNFRQWTNFSDQIDAAIEQREIQHAARTA